MSQQLDSEVLEAGLLTAQSHCTTRIYTELLGDQKVFQTLREEGLVDKKLLRVPRKLNAQAMQS